MIRHIPSVSKDIKQIGQIQKNFFFFNPKNESVNRKKKFFQFNIININFRHPIKEHDLLKNTNDRKIRKIFYQKHCHLTQGKFTLCNCIFLKCR